MLADLGMFSEALQMLADLLHGEWLPRQGDIGFKAVEERQVCPFCIQIITS